MHILEARHKELINILDELIVTIKLMNPTNRNYFMNQNLREAKDWRRFLKAHTDKEELMSLHDEISERFFYKYNEQEYDYVVKFGYSELDHKRVSLMKEFLGKSYKYLKEENHMKTNDEIEKKYQTFKKSVDNLKTVRNIEKPYSVISRTGIVGLFNMCCDSAYLLVKNILEFQGYIFPVTTFPSTIIRTGSEFGLLDDENIWNDIIDTRNMLAHSQGEDTAMKAIEKIKSEYIPVFEKLDQDIADRLAEENLPKLP